MTDQPIPPAEGVPAKPTGGQFAAMAKVLAAIGAVGGVLLHLIGAAAHQAYWEQWGLDPAMFPKATDLTIVLGYEAVWVSTFKAVAVVVKDYLLPLTLFGVLFATCIVGMLWLARSRFREPVYALWAKQSTVREGIEVMAVSIVVFAVAIPAILVLVVFVLILPVAMGEAHGKELVAEQLQDFKQGCDSPFAINRCATLMRGTDTVGRGFLIGASSSHIAIFDPQMNCTVLVERQGLQMVGAPKLTAYPPGMLPRVK